MSQSLFLVKYETSEDGKMYEVGSEVIESAFISADLFEKISDNYSLAECEIFEAIGSEESSQIDCIDGNKIDSIQVLLENEFLSLLVEESTKNKYVRIDIVSKTDLYESINKFKTLANLISLFKLKTEKYQNVTSALIKIG